MDNIEKLIYLIDSLKENMSLMTIVLLIVTILSILSLAIGPIATIATLMGKNLTEIITYLTNKKDRSVIKYIILKKSGHLELNNAFYNESPIKNIRTVMEISKACWIVMAPLLTIYFISPWVSSEEPDTKRAYAYILICLFSLIAAELFYKIMIAKKDKDKNKKYFLIKALCIIFINCIGLLIILYFVSDNNAYGIYFTLTVMSVLNFLITQISFTIIDASKKVIIICTLRVIFGIFFIVYILFKTVDEQIISGNIRMLFSIIWAILCGVEYIINDITRNKYLQYVEYSINMAERTVKTINSIYQYKCDKVKCILNDGNIEIVDNEVINYIEYTLKTYFSIKRKTNSNGICLLKNEEKLEFDDYKYIKDSWVAFYKIDKKNEKQVKIFHMDKIKKISIAYVSKSL